MPTTGTKLYTHRTDGWHPVYAELFDDRQKRAILEAFDASLSATGFVPETTWGERIEDRGSQITFSALGQQAPIHAKDRKSTRLNPVTNAHLVCRLLLEKQKKNIHTVRTTTEPYNYNTHIITYHHE